MQYSLTDTKRYFSYYHVTLMLGELKRYMGRVNHFQVIELPAELRHPDISHSVRFYDGSTHRELLGTVCPAGDGAIVLNMGHGKTYRFDKQAC